MTAMIIIKLLLRYSFLSVILYYFLIENSLVFLLYIYNIYVKMCRVSYFCRMKLHCDETMRER